MKKTIWVTFCVISWLDVQAQPLNSFLYDYAFTAMHNQPRTGRLYEVTPPANLSGLQVSFLRLRAHSLWRNGANLGKIEIPNATSLLPFTKRVDLLYQNFGNLSSFYYNVPNHTFVTPVVGFLAYDSMMSHQGVELRTRGETHITVMFENVPEDSRMMCVEFRENGTWELSDLVGKGACWGRGEGHFSIVMPREESRKDKNGVLKWWAVGIPVVGLVVFLVAGIVVGFKMFQWRKVGILMKNSENGVGLDSVWIGNSRVPSATAVRTPPVLENNYVP